MVSKYREISDNWTQLIGRIEDMCDELSRPPPIVVAVSKTQGIEEVQAAIDVGITNFGENYAQELEKKAIQFPDVQWHYMGTIQSRHLGSIAKYTSLIHTLQREKIISKLANQGYSKKILVQVNISGEVSKSGIEFNKQVVSSFVDKCHQLRLPVDGLMGIADFDWNKETILHEFTRLVNMGKDLELNQFSLGMSGDWEEAILSGATILRIGTLIFGRRA